MEIRNPNKTHLPQIMELLAACMEPVPAAETVSRNLFYDEAYDPNHVWMAREAGQTLGFLHTVQREEKAWIKALVVAPAARRKGLARDLLSRAEYRLSGEGVKEVRVEATPPLQFYHGVQPASAAALCFQACGYSQGPDADRLSLKALAPLAPQSLDLAKALELARELCGEDFNWAEEQLACRPPKALCQDGVLCLFEPGQSLGPLWAAHGASEQTIKSLSAAALAAASRSALNLQWWQVPASRPWPLKGLQHEIRSTYTKLL